jgi:hypothetical protein
MYEQTVKLQNNEKVFKVNVDDGEISAINRRANNIPKDSFILKSIYMKRVSQSWAYLRGKCTPKELEIVNHLVDITNHKNNSLAPLGDDVSMRVLSDQFNISLRDVNRVFDKLFKLGVYGKFEVYKEIYHKYWVLNPYLAFSGRLVKNELASLFHGTEIHKAYLESLK